MTRRNCEDCWSEVCLCPDDDKVKKETKTPEKFCGQCTGIHKFVKIGELFKPGLPCIIWQGEHDKKQWRVVLNSTRFGFTTEYSKGSDAMGLPKWETDYCPWIFEQAMKDLYLEMKVPPLPGKETTTKSPETYHDIVVHELRTENALLEKQIRALADRKKAEQKVLDAVKNLAGGRAAQHLEGVIKVTRELLVLESGETKADETK